MNSTFTRRDALNVLAAGGASMALSLRSSAAMARGVSASSIKIGGFMPLTGPVALAGEQVRAGAVSCVEMVNAAGGVNGRKIEYVIEDNAYSVQQTIAATRKLVAGDNIFALLNCNGAAHVTAVLPYTREQEVPIISPWTGQIDWFNPPQPHVYSVFVLFEKIAQALGRWAAKEGHRKIVLVHFDAAVSQRIGEYAKPGAKSVAGDAEVELIAVKLDTQDHAPVALEIARRSPDAVITINVLQQLVFLSRAMRDRGLKTPIYTYAPNVLQFLVELGPDVMEGVKGLSWTQSPFADEPAVKEYRDALAKYFPAQKPDFTSLFNFASVKVFVEALRRIQGEITPASLYAALESMHDYKTGILPPVSFSKDQHLGNTKAWPMQVKNGRWVPVGELIDTASDNW